MGEHILTKMKSSSARVNPSGTDLVTNGSPLQTALKIFVIYANFVESSYDFFTTCTTYEMVY